MAVPIIQQLRVGAYIIGKKLRGIERYPLVLMLEPLFRCNLACAGCGKIDYAEPILNKRLSLEECLAAVEECGAPVVIIPGGEPLLHKEIDKIVAGLARAQEVRLSLHQRAVAGKEAAPVQAEQVLHLLGASRRTGEAPRPGGRPAGRVRARGRGDPQGARPRLPGHRQLHPVQHDDRAERRPPSSTSAPTSSASRASPSRRATPTSGRPRQEHFLNRTRTKQLFRDIFKLQGEARSGGSTSRPCSSTSSPATRPIAARPGATRRATSSAGSGRATCSARATPRRSAS